jgi:hypothetical protein
MVSKRKGDRDLLSVDEYTEKMEQSKLQAVAHQNMLDDDDDFGEGEAEDTINLQGSKGAAALTTPHHKRKDSHGLKQSR